MNAKKMKRKGAIVLEGELLRAILLHIKCRIEKDMKSKTKNIEVRKD